ncbi:MAG: ATP-binding protein [Oligoflexia bacterium]|nr:ATP-binding protein [Oligoflexia bacterium]
MTKKENLLLLIKEGEGLTVEFKERYTSKIAHDIVAFANSKGGKILLGVADDGSIKGAKLTGQLRLKFLDWAEIVIQESKSM